MASPRIKVNSKSDIFPANYKAIESPEARLNEFDAKWQKFSSLSEQTQGYWLQELIEKCRILRKKFKNINLKPLLDYLNPAYIPEDKKKKFSDIYGELYRVLNNNKFSPNLLEEFLNLQVEILVKAPSEAFSPPRMAAVGSPPQSNLSERGVKVMQRKDIGKRRQQALEAAEVNDAKAKATMAEWVNGKNLGQKEELRQKLLRKCEFLKSQFSDLNVHIKILKGEGRFQTLNLDAKLEKFCRQYVFLCSQKETFEEAFKNCDPSKDKRVFAGRSHSAEQKVPQGFLAAAAAERGASDDEDSEKEQKKPDGLLRTVVGVAASAFAPSAEEQEAFAKQMSQKTSKQLKKHLILGLDDEIARLEATTYSKKMASTVADRLEKLRAFRGKLEESKNNLFGGDGRLALGEVAKELTTLRDQMKRTGWSIRSTGYYSIQALIDKVVYEQQIPDNEMDGSSSTLTERTEITRKLRAESDRLRETYSIKPNTSYSLEDKDLEIKSTDKPEIRVVKRRLFRLRELATEYAPLTKVVDRGIQAGDGLWSRGLKHASGVATEFTNSLSTAVGQGLHSISDSEGENLTFSQISKDLKDLQGGMKSTGGCLSGWTRWGQGFSLFGKFTVTGQKNIQNIIDEEVKPKIGKWK